MFEEEEPGKPKNWGCTVAIITFIMLVNMSIFIICRVLLDSEDENDESLLQGKVRENLTFFLGIFSMSFCFFCCCCFCCGGSLCRWIANWHFEYLDVSKIWSGAIKTTKVSTHRKRDENNFMRMRTLSGSRLRTTNSEPMNELRDSAYYTNAAYANSPTNLLVRRPMRRQALSAARLGNNNEQLRLKQSQRRARSLDLSDDLVTTRRLCLASAGFQ